MAIVLAFHLTERMFNSAEDLNASNTVEKENFDAQGQIDEQKMEKDLLKHLIASLGSPCSQVGTVQRYMDFVQFMRQQIEDAFI